MAETKVRELRSYPRNRISAVGVSSTEMQDVLERVAPASASAALSALRRAFPSVPLQERVRACEAYAQNFRF